jgi:phenylpyruvate tautomerase PptA (4-oxalocrotonate tautomerase family)
MVLTRNQKIAAGIVGVALLTVGTILVVKAVRKRGAAKKRDLAEKERDAYKATLEKESKVTHVASEDVMPEFKGLVRIIPNESKDEFLNRMDEIATTSDALKHSKYPTNKD